MRKPLSPEQIAHVLFDVSSDDTTMQTSDAGTIDVPNHYVEQKHVPTDIARNEFRYLIQPTNLQQPVLVSWASIQNAYRTRTIYLDTPEGTWTRGKSQTKIRLRNYNLERTWWIEVKSNTTGHIEKHRRLIFAEDFQLINQLVPIVVVTYRRREYESPKTSPGLRVTVDADLLCWQLPDNLTITQALYEQGRPIAKLDALVLETKGPDVFPAWLPLPKPWAGSKSRWSLAALACEPEKVGPSITNASLAGAMAG